MAPDAAGTPFQNNCRTWFYFRVKAVTEGPRHGPSRGASGLLGGGAGKAGAQGDEDVVRILPEYLPAKAQNGASSGAGAFLDSFLEHGVGDAQPTASAPAAPWRAITRPRP